ncbi:hypothetical protein CTE05_16820 [Cellulomonas terrae]|uniref:Uncharacterized protein n=1 Tax=Cellulomonas terrae TaxID=311234 RepID=A0A511JJQ7_9CELL|nr:hypothetical protein CTE05_16820 [Cellulomonas terrae]
MEEISLARLARELGTTTGITIRLASELSREIAWWRPASTVRPKLARQIRAAYLADPPPLPAPYDRVSHHNDDASPMPPASSPRQAIGWWPANEGDSGRPPRWHRNVNGRCADPQASRVGTGTVIGVGPFAEAKSLTRPAARVCEACRLAAPPEPWQQRERGDPATADGPRRQRAVGNPNRWTNYL